MNDYRLSFYTIFIKLDNSKGKYMLVHGYTGAIDIASEKLVACLRSGEPFSAEDATFSAEILQSLIDRGYITQKTEEQERTFVQKMADVYHRQHKLLSSFTFLVTYNCNFRCPYCYEGGVSDSGRQWSGAVFTKEMVDNAYKAIEQIQPDEKRRVQPVPGEGGGLGPGRALGEPLLAENKEIVSYIVSEGRKQKFEFAAVTNGYDLDHYLDLLGDDGINWLQITIDGMKEWHDSRRIHYRTTASFDRIVRNIGLALDKGVTIVVRMNTDARNFADAEKLDQLFRELGYYKDKKLSISSALLVGGYDQKSDKGNNEDSRKIDYLTRPAFNRLHKQSSENIICQDSGIMNNIYRAIRKRQTLPVHAVFCQSQTGSYILDPFGDMYACWDVVGKPEHVIGHFAPEVTWSDEMKNWQERNIGNTEKCSRCKYALLCGGGCLGKALGQKGSFTASYCDAYPDTFHMMANKAYSKYLRKQNNPK